MFKPQQAGHAFGDHRFTSVRQRGEQWSQRGARLETGNAQQDQIVVCGDGDFGEDGIFFQFGQLRFAQAAALNPRETAVAVEDAQVAPHFAFGITVRGKQMLIGG